MKKTLWITLLALTALQVNAQDLPSELQSPDVVSVNRLPMRAQSFAFENRQLAEGKAKEKSAYFISLNGQWKFNWVKDPRKRPLDFYKTDFNDAGWDNFKVPANWETNGYGTPIYVNQPYEFAGRQLTGARMNPPYDIPADNNPVGSYRKKITIPENWKGRQVFINLGAVKSCFFIWVNGKKVGYSEDSKLAAEFDITKFVKTGENVVALQVYRWSDASYLECQDMWRISGIERDVYMYSTPKLNVWNYKTIATLDPTYTNGQLSASIDVESYKIDRNTNHSKPDSFYVSLDLVDAKGTKVWNKDAEMQTILGNYHKKLDFEGEIKNVKTWSAETPYLYTLYIILKDSKKNIVQVVPQRIGFRSIEIKGSDFLVNGKRVFLKGVNRHEHNPTQGHTLTKSDMLKDMEMMKKLNVNAVRHSHYPPDPYWMQLCDEYGLYVVDEANIESHGRYYSLETTFANDRQWRNPHLERVLRMYERDKNHPSVVTWSLGNEAGNGVNFYEAYEWLKKNDIRPVQYERAEHDYNTDMIVPQYPSPNGVLRYSKQDKETRPFIMSEYAHIMGNSLGNFKEYWDVIENNPKTQGGFIWEWIDQAIDTVKNGKRIMAYGGDFPLSGPVDENFSDNNFCVKGVVTAYRGMTPMAVEVKKVYQYIKTAYNGNGQINVFNGYFFKDLSNVQLNWELVENGKVIQKGSKADLNIAARQTANLDIPFKNKFAQDKAYFLNIRYTLKTAEPFLEKGYEIAYEQLSLAGKDQPLVYAPAKGKLSVEQAKGKAIVRGANFVATFDLTNGLLSNYSVNGQPIMTAGPQPGFYRAPTDNDIGAGLNKSLRMWRNVYRDASASDKKATVSKTENVVTISVESSLLKGDGLTKQVFTVYPDGVIKVDNQFKAVNGNYKSLMRIGNDLQLNKDLSNIKWYGRGPGENYNDRNSASLVGIYQSTLDQQYFPYARPQESGNKIDVRWVDFTNKAGKGLRFEFADQLLSFNALPYAVEDLDPEAEKKQYHSGELVKRNQTYVHMDLVQLGVQGIDSWGSMPLIQYQIPFKDYNYSYYIKPIK